MYNSIQTFSFPKTLLLFLFCNTAIFAQKTDSLKKTEPLQASANIQITNNGVSLFPNLMLGKPAAIINLTVGKKHIFFEPELRWRLNGEPWSYIFWLRYRPKRTEHFSWHVGGHPSYVVRPSQVTINGKTENRWISQRYLAAEFVPVWHQSPKFSLGLHLLASKGLDSYAIKKSTYVSIQPRFPNIGISKNYYLGFFPQVFHLTLDNKKGVYYSQMLSFNRKKLPVYVSSIFTYKIKSTIAGDNVVWNVGLNYRL
ncbi:hypothetical protein [Emticicia oligotrophica]|uniref:hypothetical protein n=1 Tax=Emticicia oligotrophica TaxID=312279 RepID=UPI00273A7907|nr:hypothetical protein [Emticicia oligotrophica]